MALGFLRVSDIDGTHEDAKIKSPLCRRKKVLMAPARQLNGSPKRQEIGRDAPIRPGTPTRAYFVISQGQRPRRNAISIPMRSSQPSARGEPLCSSEGNRESLRKGMR